MVEGCCDANGIATTAPLRERVGVIRLGSFIARVFAQTG